MISQLQQQLQHQSRHYTFDTSENNTNLSQFCLNLPEFNTTIHTISEYDKNILENNQQSIEQGKLNINNDNVNPIGNGDIKPKICTTISSTSTTTTTTSTTIDEIVNSTENIKQSSSIINHCLSKKNKLDNQLNDYNKSISVNSSLPYRLCYSPNTTTTTITICDKNNIEFNEEICYTTKYPRLHDSLSESNKHNNSNITDNNNDRNILDQTGNPIECYEFQKNVKQLINAELNNHLKNESISMDYLQQTTLPLSSLLLSSSTCISSLNNPINNEYILSSMKNNEMIHENNNNHDDGDDDNNNVNKQNNNEFYRRRNNSMLDSLHIRLDKTMEKIDVLNHLQKFTRMQLDYLDFADDLALLSHTQQQMQKKTTNVAAASATVGLNIHKWKSKTLRYNTS
ncbi:unnamed protein product [Schistosoma margrebowiei]|uniref:Uncharacterized protein n=1 Tax=Schistosoma margrebowiei TaxID=48269 RepID=A0A183LFL6_9TREM|nr:unnamed protein product [Schistosoma margrebowiei]